MPERILQFGTGVLLRGLVDFAIQQANDSGHFCGSIIQVKSTRKGNLNDFSLQDNIYHVVVRGIQQGRLVQEVQCNHSISRSIDASTNWSEILSLARLPDLNIIVSNTTELGLQLDARDRLGQNPPNSFPAKLLEWLYTRFLHFEGAVSAGCTLLPTELVSNNGDVLLRLLNEQANAWGLPQDFKDWLNTHNSCCNTLVDRIVPGKPDAGRLEHHQQQLGWKDELLIECEPYLLWAIEGNALVKERLSFAGLGNGVLVEPSIEQYKEMKLRLLNGAHSFLCGYAHLHGFSLVREAMQDPGFALIIQELLLQEMVPTLSYEEKQVELFAAAVLERFANPFIDHQWLSISLNYTQKMANRNAATVKRYMNRFGRVPVRMAEGFAWYLRFIRFSETGSHFGWGPEGKYAINDPSAVEVNSWLKAPITLSQFDDLFRQEHIWGERLNVLPGFVESVYNSYLSLDV